MRDNRKTCAVKTGLKSHFLIDEGSEFMGSSESSNNSLRFIKYRKIDHGKSVDFRDEYPQSLQGSGWHP